jgi:hypothetical protein
MLPVPLVPLPSVDETPLLPTSGVLARGSENAEGAEDLVASSSRPPGSKAPSTFAKTYQEVSRDFVCSLRWCRCVFKKRGHSRFYGCPFGGGLFLVSGECCNEQLQQVLTVLHLQERSLDVRVQGRAL